MSLQVWLPLNGSLDNLGLISANISLVGNPTINNNGKIGSCYTFNGTNGIAIAKQILPSNSPEWSFSCWFSLDNITSTSAACLFSERTAQNATGYTIFIYPNSSQVLVDDGARWYVVPMTFVANTWYHLVITRNTSGKKLYINGELKSSTSTIGTTTSVNSNGCLIGLAQSSSDLTTGNQGFIGKINDARIYNHALSDNEIKEISKGLVLRYTLSDPYIELTTNLVTREDGLSDTCYNGATGKYSWGTNTDMYKGIVTYKGRKCTQVSMGTSGLSAYPYVYFDAFSAAGTTVQTLSFDYFPSISLSSQKYIIPYSYNGAYDWVWSCGGNSGSATNVSSITIPVELSKWNHVVITAKKTDSTNTTRGIGYIRLGNAAHTSSTNYTWFFSNIQVEAKDHATGYAGVNGTRSSTQVYDISGYANNGVGSSNISVLHGGPKFNNNCSFDGASGSAITMPNLSTLLTDTTFTMNCWFKKTTGEWSFKSWETIFGGPSGFELSSKSSTTNSPCLYAYSWGKGTYVYTLDEWHMLTMVRTSSDTKFYMDGELRITGSTGSIPSGNYFIGAWRDVNSQNFRGNIQDFSLYATALSADDVYNLYKCNRL